MFQYRGFDRRPVSNIPTHCFLMHPRIGILKCVDCEDAHEFSSAASLLSHFAQHILDSDSSGVEGIEQHCTDQASTWKKKNGSILEQVLQRTASKHKLVSDVEGETSTFVQKLPPTRLRAKPSSKSIFQLSKSDKIHISSPLNEKDSRDVDGETAGVRNGWSSMSSRCSSSSSGSVSSSPTLKIIDGSSVNSSPVNNSPMNGSPVSLATFDMQQRLENCVLNLVSKHSGLRHMLPEAWDATTGEEINPLTLCTVTIDECETGFESTETKSLDLARKGSNRKQQMPKKISRPVEGMLSELSSKLPHNTTITTINGPEQDKHHGKKKYPCHICSKVFGWSTDLKRHILIHTGERPFKCKMCPSSFTRNFLLQKHENKVHHRHSGKNGINNQFDTAGLKTQTVESDSKMFSLGRPPPENLPNENVVMETSEEDRSPDADDQSSADENDNINRKRKNMEVGNDNQCVVKQQWQSSGISKQQALQEI